MASSNFGYTVELADSRSIKSAASITFSAGELQMQESSFPRASIKEYEFIPLKQLTMYGPFKMWSSVKAQLTSTNLIIYKDEAKSTLLYEFQLCCLHTTKYVQNAFLTEDESKRCFLIWDHNQNIKVTFSEDPVIKRDVSFYALLKERCTAETLAFAKRLCDSSVEDKNAIYKMCWAWEKGTTITWRPVFLVVSETHLIFMANSPKTSDEFLGTMKFKVKECNARSLDISEIFDPFHVHAILINKPTGPSFVSFDFGHERVFFLKIFNNAVLRGFSDFPDMVYGCTSNGRSCQLTLSLRTGFTLTDKSNGLPVWNCRFDEVKTVYSHKEQFHIHIKRIRTIKRDVSVQSVDSISDGSKLMLKKALIKGGGSSPSSPTSPGQEGVKEEILLFPNVTTPVAIVNIFQNMTSRLLLQDKP